MNMMSPVDYHMERLPIQIKICIENQTKLIIIFDQIVINEIYILNRDTLTSFSEIMFNATIEDIANI